MDAGSVALRSINHMSAKVAYWSADRRCVFANSTYREQLPANGPEPVGMAMRDVLGPIIHQTLPFIRRVLAGERQQFTLRVPQPDGSAGECVVTYTPDVVEGRVVGFTEHVADVTSNRTREIALRRSTDLLGRVGALAHVGGAELDLETNEVFWTQEMFRMLDVDPPTAPAPDRWVEFFPSEAVPSFLAASEALRSHGTPCDFETPMVTAKGRHIWVRLTASASFANGNVTKLIATHQDITQQKHAEAELLLQAAALQATATPMVITDPNGTVEWINPAFTQCTGYSAAEAVGRNPRELVKSGVHDRAFYKELWDTIQTGRVWHGELTNRRKDGTLYPESQTITPVRDAAGEIKHFVAVKRDLTRDKELEARFLQIQKMETVGHLAGGIAHDFNNLLTVINGTVELLLADSADAGSRSAELTAIQDAGSRAADLTRQLLAFSRKQMMRPVVFDLNARVEGLRPMLTRLLGEDIRLNVQLTSAIGLIHADPPQVDQVVLNLAVNSRDAMPGGGILTITTEVVELDAVFAARHPTVRPGPHVMLAISDTGVGMDEATRARLFEPFFTTKEPGHGTGLGLSTVYGIVKQLGGTIWVYSELGHGTIIKIYYPQVDAVGPDPAPVRMSAESAGAEAILVVEDDSALQRLAASVLRAEGYTVFTASDAAEAMSLLEQHGALIRLLLTDLILPGADGWALATRVAGAYPDLRVLFTSGYADDTIRRHGASGAMTHFIAKPYMLKALAQAVRSTLDAPPPTFPSATV